MGERFRVLEGPPGSVEMTVSHLKLEGYRETSRDWCAGFLQVTMERPPTKVEEAVRVIRDSGHFSEDQVSTLAEALGHLDEED